MLEITVEEVVEYVEKHSARFSYHKGKKEVEAYQFFDFSDAETPQKYFVVEMGKKTLLKTQDREEFRRFLIENDVKMEKINDVESMAAFFDYIHPKLLSSLKYLDDYADCDSFSLSAICQEEYVSKEEGAVCLKEIIEEEKARLKKKYEEERKTRSDLQPFEVFYENVLQDCISMKEKMDEIFKGKFEERDLQKIEACKRYKDKKNSFFFGDFYNNVGIHAERISNLKTLQNNPKTNRPTDILDREEYKPLKEHLLKSKLTFKTHCTISGQLQKEFYFAFNEQTKRVLSVLRMKEWTDLQDLAFYKNGKIRFSSCTHEGYEDDISE